MNIQLFPPDRRRRDIDNVLKPLLDALEHGKAYIDDSQIKKLGVEMFGATKNPKTIIEFCNR